jgi:molybdenum cofactor biosynthesis enzyme MoaA
VGHRFDFANILFGGPCNQRCPNCIGKQLPPNLCRENLSEFPLRNLELFAELLERENIRQIILTGTSTDPQLYHHEPELIRWLRSRLPNVHLSLHTNGRRALERMHVLNMYDKATISLPSFDRHTFFKMTGTWEMPELTAILAASSIPVKVSCLLSEHNVAHLGQFLARCRLSGIRRVALRQQYGDERQWHILSGRQPASYYRGNPVYDIGGLEVTYWRFERCTCTSVNLFPDGTITTTYLLSRSTDTRCI